VAQDDNAEPEPVQEDDPSKARPPTKSSSGSTPEQQPIPKSRRAASTPPKNVPVEQPRVGQTKEDGGGLEPEAGPDDTAESAVATEPEADLEDEAPVADDSGVAAAMPTASLGHAPVAHEVTQPTGNAVPNESGAWMSGVLARGAHEESAGGGSRLLGWLQREPERESPRRGAASFFDSGSNHPRTGKRLLVGLVVLLATVLALGAIVWKIIGIGQGNSRSSTTDPRSRVTQTHAGLQSNMTVTPEGGLVGVIHLVLDHPIPSLTVKVLTPAANTSLSDFEPIISHLTLAADGQRIMAVGRDLHSGDKVKLPLPAGARSLDLSYHADGVMKRNKPSAPGRASVLLTPMIVAPADNLYGSISVHSSYVTNVGCSIAGAALIACGTATSDGWRVTAPPGQGGVNVLAQVTLPAA
jgi:hypothetical protein